ncbi:MAG: endonuclease MutS2 [Aquificota bacterium]|nr:endonuclease MutS2 [Aquificota bacterium]
MRERDLEKLEFNRVKEKLKEFVHSPATEEVVDRLRPMTDPEEVKRSIEVFESFRKVGDLPFHEFGDIRPSLEKSKIENAVLSVDEILEILKVLKLIREVRKHIGKVSEEDPPLRVLSRKLHLFSSLENLIEGCIDRRGFVKDEASEDLFRIRRSIKDLEREITERLESLLRRPDADKVFTDRIITLRNNRYVVPVKTSQMKKVFGIVHGTSSSGYTTYVEPHFVIQLNNKLTELKEKEEEEVRKVLARITAYVGDFADKILESFTALLEADLLNAKRKLSESYGGVFPEIGDFVDLRGVRHPLLTLMNPDTVPVDIRLRETRGVILTGPNTGGKTVALKTLGLVTLMVQSGIPVPLKEGSVIRVFRKVFVDIGDEQSIDQNLSTFSSHMTNMAEFFREVGPDTLVLLDELGAGTDPSEGSALGIGILEFLKGKGAWVFANTHHTPVKIYAVRSDYYTPATVLFDPDTLKPLYRIVYGSVGESMALTVARRCGVPEEIVKNAEERVGGGEEEYREAVKRLSDLARDYQRKLEEVEKLKEDLKRERERYEKLYEEYMEFKRRAWKEVYREARGFLRRISEEAREVLKRAKSLKEVEEFVRRQENLLNLFRGGEADIKVGDRVEVMGREGKVVEIKGNKARVVSGSMKIWVSLDLISKAGNVRREVKEIAKITPVKGEINLIGMDPETAILELERFLEEAYSAGLGSVKVIHGIGKGVLKRAVREFLSKNEKVKFFRDAYPKEGGSGVTVVFLKAPE